MAEILNGTVVSQLSHQINGFCLSVSLSPTKGNVVVWIFSTYSGSH